MVVVNVSCGANICPLYYKTKFHVLIDVNQIIPKNVFPYHDNIQLNLLR